MLLVVRLAGLKVGWMVEKKVVKLVETLVETKAEN